jgi:hypothetical protein
MMAKSQHFCGPQVPRLDIGQWGRLYRRDNSRLSPLPTFHAYAPVQNRDGVILPFVS